MRPRKRQILLFNCIASARRRQSYAQTSWRLSVQRPGGQKRLARLQSSAPADRHCGLEIFRFYCSTALRAPDEGIPIHKNRGDYRSKEHAGRNRQRGCNRLLQLIITAVSKSSDSTVQLHCERPTKAFLCTKIVATIGPKSTRAETVSAAAIVCYS